MRFDGKNVIVTGGSRGIGRAIALMFVNNGANVVITYVKNEEEVKRTVSLTSGNRISYYQLDVTNEKQVIDVVGMTEHKLGSIDILVNNAGTFKNNLVHNMSNDEWDSIMDVNLTGVFNCTRAVLSYMYDKKYGKIINITSVQGQTGVIGAANYSASKAGVIAFTKSVARESAKKGVNVNAVAFGFINTGMLLRLPSKIQEEVLTRIPMGRFGTPEEASNVVLFLASEYSSYITGQVINVNGGYYM